MHITLVGCSTQKDRDPELIPASSRYTSPLFKKSLAFAQLHSDHVAIVSGKYGLVLTEQLIADYDEKLDPKKASEWAKDVVSELVGIFGEPTSIYLMAGGSYANPLRGALAELYPDVVVEEPLAGMTIGERLAFLNDHEKVCNKIAANRGPCSASPSPRARRAALRERARRTIEQVKGLVAFDMGATSPPDWRPFVIDLAQVVAELLEVEP